MEQLPKIVRERLRATEAGNHPDPDLLAAFAEQHLPEVERVAVLEHLSRCAACREVVRLAAEAVAGAPAEAAPALAPAGEARRAAARSWLRPRVLGWAAVAAGVLLAAGLVAHYEWNLAKPAPTRLAATNRVAPVASPPAAKPGREVAQNSLPGQEAIAPGRALQERMPGVPASAGGKKRMAAAKGPMASARVQGGAGRGALSEKAAPSAVAASKAPKTLAGLFAKKVPAKAGAMTGGAIPPATAKLPPQIVIRSETQTAEAFVPPALQKPLRTQSARTAGAAGGAAPAVVGGVIGGVAGGVAPAPPPAVMPSKEAAVTKLSVWTLSRDGALERSTDFGKTWAVVEVGEGNRFRALSAAGREVWVGGADGLLFHSADAGAHWTRVQPVANGVALTDTIARIEFTGALHGRLVTSGGEAWMTTDGGLTWQKQQE